MNKKLSVLFLCGWYPSRVSPYNGDFIQRHAEAVSTQHNVSIIHIISDKSLQNNIEYTFNIINGVETHIAYVKFKRKKLAKFFYYFRAFKLLLKKVKPFQIVHLNEVFPFGLLSLYLRWFKHTPFIISEHWTGYHQTKSISFLEKHLSKIITKNASFICPVSDNLANSMKLFGLNGNYIKVPNVVNTNLFSPQYTAKNVFTVTHISNMNNNHKNIKGIINVICEIQEEIQNFKFQFIGENSHKYRNYAEQLGINSENIVFYDQISHQKVSDILKKSNLFVLFSNYENLPCVILEAFSCGIPVISTDVGGIHEYFPNGYGKLIAINDQKKLKQEIVNFYNGKNISESKQKMHNYVKSLFSEQKLADDFSKLYYKSLNI
jgi:glycosyltransferase involved in cell wall biosynthesis